jgi:flagella basal body P-ring formation protein FlgA
MIRNLILVATSLAAFGTSAGAAEQERPKLRAQATVTGDIVRVGDLVDHAGIIAKVPIFRAPDLGATGSVSADAVVEAVRAHALIGLDTGDLSEVTVTRASRAIPAKDVEERIAKALSTQYRLGPAKDIVVNFDRELRVLQLDATAKGEPRVAYLNFDARNGRFDVTLDVPTSATTRGTLRLSGRAAATVEVITVTRPVERGEILKVDDVQMERRPRDETGRDIVVNADRAIGFAARQSLQPGRPLRAADLMRPESVLRNETVTLIYEVPGITLTVRGKATEGGAVGDTISVLNEQSKRTVQGVVAGPGRVIVGTGAPRLAANLPPIQTADNAEAR